MLRNSKTFHHNRANWRLDYLLYQLSLIRCLNTAFFCRVDNIYKRKRSGRQVRHDSQMSSNYEVITSYGMFRTLVTKVLVSVIGF
jgi:hypothetical protein